MKKLSILTALVALTFLVSCKPTGFSESDLIGKWENAEKAGDFKVYTDKSAIPYPPDSANPYNGYKWGKEWYEKEVSESDLVEHGNGWYMWKMEGKQITEIHQTDAHTALSPTTLTIQTLTSSQFQFERAGRTYIYNKK